MLYRTCFEWNAALGWYLATFMVMVGSSPSSWLELSREAGGSISGCWLIRCCRLQEHDRSHTHPQGTSAVVRDRDDLHHPSELRLHNLVGKKRGANSSAMTTIEETLLGYGLTGALSTNMSYQLMNMDSKRAQIVMPMPVRWYVQQHEAETRKMGGAAWIYNLGKMRCNGCRPTTGTATLITGNVGSGKRRCCGYCPAGPSTAATWCWRWTRRTTRTGAMP